MKKYIIEQIGLEGVVMAQCPTLDLAKKYLKEIKKTDEYLSKYYNWEHIPKYRIVEEIFKEV